MGNRCHSDPFTVLFILQAAWNGSVSHNWANRITKYRDTITEDSPTLNNGALNMLITDNGMVNELNTVLYYLLVALALASVNQRDT